jgi:hypothetical protein
MALGPYGGYCDEYGYCVALDEPADEGDGSIDCSGISPDLPCHAMLLIDEVRDAQSLRDVDPEIFCPCKLVRDAAPNWSPEVVGSCSGSGGGGR